MEAFHAVFSPHVVQYVTSDYESKLNILKKCNGIVFLLFRFIAAVSLLSFTIFTPLLYADSLRNRCKATMIGCFIASFVFICFIVIIGHCKVMHKLLASLKQKMIWVYIGTHLCIFIMFLISIILQNAVWFSISFLSWMFVHVLLYWSEIEEVINHDTEAYNNEMDRNKKSLYIYIHNITDQNALIPMLREMKPYKKYPNINIKKQTAIF
jgi:hypothetical protein